MNLSRKILVLVPMLFGLPAFANELTKDLQKACVSEQLRDHKGVSGHSLEANSFTEYCKWAVFKQFDRIYSARAGTEDWLRMPDRGSRCDEMTDEQRIAKINELNK